MRARVAVAAVALVGCDGPAPPAPAPSASAVTVPDAPRASASAAGGSAPATTRTWSGTYQAQHYRIEAPRNEGAREWTLDDGGAHAGKGTLAFAVNETGSIRGTASGPLGEHDVMGEVDGDVFRVRLVPKQPGERAFSGFALLERKGQTLTGRLQASSGDSKTVRDAVVTLTEGEPRSKLAPSASAAPSASR